MGLIPHQGRMPELPAQSPVGIMQEAANLYRFLSLSLSLKDQ